MKTWLLNGKPILAEKAQSLDVFSQEYVSGVFETFRSFSGNFWRIEDHFVRLAKSATLLDIIVPVSDEVIFEALRSLLTVDMDFRYKFWTDGVDWWIKVLPLENLDFTQGIAVVDQVFARSLAAAKHGAPFYPAARKYCAEHAAFEVLWFDESDILLEGSITNVFAIIDGVLCTPSLGNILPGLMRSWILDQEVPVKLRDISREQLLSAHEIFCTNMVRGIIPVARWGDWQAQSFSMAEKLTETLHSNLPK